jgi:hypothetical protein
VAGEVAYAAGTLDSGLVLEVLEILKLARDSGRKTFWDWVATSEESGVVLSIHIGRNGGPCFLDDGSHYLMNGEIRSTAVLYWMAIDPNSRTF